MNIAHETLIETTEHGWYYLTPLPEGKVAIAFITDADILKTLNLNDRTEWENRALQTCYIKRTLEKLGESEAFRHYAIHSRVASLPQGKMWTAAGDAAACFDPIASLGIGHAVNSGIHSARVAEAGLNGDISVSLAYNKALLEHFGTYRSMRKGFYSAEKRWATSPFWQRRAIA
jgi:flavin-dependent dehydrogenase